MSGGLLVPADYGALLADVKRRIQTARSRAVLAVNAEQKIGRAHV